MEDAANAPSIERHGRTRVLGTLPFLPTVQASGLRPDTEALAKAAEEHLDLQALWDAI